jgi:hypothetical protein
VSGLTCTTSHDWNLASGGPGKSAEKQLEARVSKGPLAGRRRLLAAQAEEVSGFEHPLACMWKSCAKSGSTHSSPP